MVRTTNQMRALGLSYCIAAIKSQPDFSRRRRRENLPRRRYPTPMSRTVTVIRCAACRSHDAPKARNGARWVTSQFGLILRSPAPSMLRDAPHPERRTSPSRRFAPQDEVRRRRTLLSASTGLSRGRPDEGRSSVLRRAQQRSPTKDAPQHEGTGRREGGPN